MTLAPSSGTPQRLVLLALIVAAAIAAWFPFRSRPTSELPVYVEGAVRMAEGEPIYRKTDPKPFTYPPFFALPFLPLTKIAREQHRLVWYAANLVALALIAWLIARLARDLEPMLGMRTVFWVGVLVISGRHLSSVLENQSHDLLIALLVLAGVDAWRRERGLWAGAWWGIAAACKATPLLFLLPLLVRREVKPLVTQIGVATLLTLLPDLLYPQSGGKLWVVAWFETFLSGLAAGGTASAEGAWTAGSFLNQSLSGTLHRLTTSVVTPSGFVQDVALVDLGPTPRRLVILISQLATLSFLAWISLRRPGGQRQRGNDCIGIAAAVVCGMVLLSPMSSKSHFCVLILPAAYCMQVWIATRDRLLGVLLIVWTLLGSFTVKGLLGIELGNMFLAYGSVTWAALLGLVSSARGLTARRSQAAE